MNMSFLHNHRLYKRFKQIKVKMFVTCLYTFYNILHVINKVKGLMSVLPFEQRRHITDANAALAIIESNKVLLGL